MKKHIIIIAVLLAVSVAAQNYCVGVGTANPTFKLDVNGNFRAQGAAVFANNVNVEGALTVANKDVCLEDGTSCPAQAGSQSPTQSSTTYTPTNINTQDTCDGNKNQAYTCNSAEGRTCEDVTPLEPGVSNQVRTVNCLPNHSSGGFYGYCRQAQGFVCVKRDPAICTAIEECACPIGYEKLTFGEQQAMGGTFTYFGCYKT